ncbi:hypothetical protein [Microcoleus sp. FACHB-68]|uniref:magnesium transporter MgtE N-terminal domain-containing protein n=1 Tax=Microcoleus sp. FACHB-68 TaxID=2692826 RepID=UPI001F55A5B6|nr:hypothetical protein [Microcoleus sp. FACHB-68]
MVTQEAPISISNIADLNQLKSQMNQLPAVDVGDYIVELSPERRAISFRLRNKSQAIDVFEYLPAEVQEELSGWLHDVQVCQIVEATTKIRKFFTTPTSPTTTAN